MEQEKINEIIAHINCKYDTDVPRLVKMLVRKKIGDLQSFDVESMPESLRECTIEELIGVVKDGLDSGKLEI